jgi:glycosyltransferase involved in cell wall biosynthesis
MKIHLIGARGFPISYASAEDIAREFGPRFVRDGHEFTVHGWASDESESRSNAPDTVEGIRRVFHKTPGGKISGQFFVALKASIAAARSDADLVFYMFVNSGIFGWIPRLAGKKVVVNINGIMWKDPKWPWGVRHIFFVGGVYFLHLVANRIVTDSRHMQELYRNTFRLSVPWIGYGCREDRPEPTALPASFQRDAGYYLIMSRITPHNLTDIMVDGFLESSSASHLFVAGHTPDTAWFHEMRERSEGDRVTFLGLVRDQALLTQMIIDARAYLHGHSLGGINPALVRVTGLGTPAICVDTVFNREVVQDPCESLHANVFEKSPASVAAAIDAFEAHEDRNREKAAALGAEIRTSMSWETIYQSYRTAFEECFED